MGKRIINVCLCLVKWFGGKMLEEGNGDKGIEFNLFKEMKVWWVKRKLWDFMSVIEDFYFFLVC